MNMPQKHKDTTPRKVKWTVGRSEKIGLPDLQLVNVKAKIDTGAYGCSMHCSEIEELYRDGRHMLRVVPLQRQKKEDERQSYYFEFRGRKIVKSSTGKAEKRYIIKTVVRLFGEEFPVEFSLTDRSNMKFPVLLGRTFLSKRFLVDVSTFNQSEKYLRKQQNKQITSV